MKNRRIFGCLEEQLAHALRGAHHAGRVHGLVRGDQDEAIHAALLGHLGHDAGARDVVLDRLADVGLHEGHVLVGRGVKHDLRLILPQHLLDTGAVRDIANDGVGAGAVASVGQLVADVEQAVLGMVEEHERTGAEGGDLPAQL
jgi:hypothetical protein